MGKPLVFAFAGANLAFELSKIDRSVLYGSKEVEVVDEQGDRCELATLADDGRTIVGRGGVTFAYLAPDGSWCEKTALKPVDLDGREIRPVASSYAAPVPLGEKVSVEDYLAHNVRSLYLLRCDGDASRLVEELRGGAIYKFPYSFRGGLEADDGFLLAGSDGNIFLAVTTPTKLEFVGLQQATGIADEPAEQEEPDLLDFDMI